ncbi:hypothetical protein EW145_g1636 [Phellinidium pouzarii]|uniref:Peptidase S53 domain-containing protein n=1 Tax=Phellinidium pouzarii TaxID=167371 RepID=A0A4S4LDS4_9AGAM|nr:hypothetical protein EW145_g1636 [Phellinidium pouzarii]
MHFALIYLFIIATSAYAIPSDLTAPVVKHAWAHIPEGWEVDAMPSANHPITLKIGLKQSRINELINTLYEVSDPLHPKYGQHLSRIEVEELVKPHPESVYAVHDWLSMHGVNIATEVARNSAGDWLSVSLPLSRVESMLAAEYRVYRHKRTDERVVRTTAYSLPRALHDHIDLVQPTTMFDNMRKMHAMFHVDESAAPLLPEGTVLPDVTGPAGYVPQAADKGNRIGVTGYLEQFVNFADLQTFYSMFRPDAVGFNVSVLSIDGGLNDQTMLGVEANLDNQYTTGISFPTPNIYYTTPGTAPTINDSVTPPQRDEPYIDWLNFVLSHDDMPFSFTTSYGGDEQTFPKEFANRACNLFAQLGARGASVMFSSGDGGVGAGTCLTNDGTNRTIFQPVFPATCPFVTGVGATFQIAPERGIDFSQGGFSVYFPRPSYQAKAVPPFLEKLGETYAGLFK